jgi:glycosyltransferase involved in cell wall biosynthesis
MVLRAEPEKKARPKVVRVIARLNAGGPARQACTLHEKLSASLDTCLVIGSLADGEQDMSYLLPSEQNVLRLSHMSREISLWGDISAFITLIKFLRREKPDIVHTHTAKAGALGRVAAWLTRVPVIVHTYHGHVFAGYFGPWKSKTYVAIERMLGRISTQVIAISELQRRDLASRYRVVPPAKISVINNGFDLNHFCSGQREVARKHLGLRSDEFVVVWGGRMVPVKDVDLLANVVRKAAEKQSRISFLVVGDGTERARLEAIVQGCKNVRLLGWRKDMDRIWAAADLALLTSRNEGTPTVLIEAMAAGVPFVATQVGGVPDLAVAPLRELPHGMGYEAANGFMAASNADALLFCMERLANDPHLAKKMGTAGRSFVLGRFSTERLVEDIQLLYQTLLTGQRSKESASVRRSSEESASEAKSSV